LPARTFVLDETFVVQSTGHHTARDAQRHGVLQNGRLYLHCSTQSVVRTWTRWRAGWVSSLPVVLISEYTGAGSAARAADR